MKIVGIVAEYNPFHNGHQYQIMRAKEITKADYVVAVMSGSFVQRGEPAAYDKWARAKMALYGGVDLVIELPVVYSVQSAECFATGAVQLLNAIGADFISFGTENDDIEKLANAANLLYNEPDKFKKELKNYLDCGISFPAAREKAAAKFGIEDLLGTPNNILAVEYIKALIKTSSKMQPVPVKRSGSMHDGIGSASYIRSIDLDEAANYMPEFTSDIAKKEVSSGKAPINKSIIENAIILKLRTVSASNLANISGVSEGLENRLIKAANACASLDDILFYAKSKRYTHSRLRRILMNTIIGITKEEIGKPPEYIRILGMNNKGKAILKNLKDKTELPIIVKAANAAISNMLDFDFKATDIYSLMYPDVNKRIGGFDKKISPVVINI